MISLIINPNKTIILNSKTIRRELITTLVESTKILIYKNHTSISGFFITEFIVSIIIDDVNYIAKMENEIVIIDFSRLFIGSYSINLSDNDFYFKNASEKVL